MTQPFVAEQQRGSRSNPDEVKPASARQISMIVSLAAERDYDLDGLAVGDLTVGREGTASALITKLLALKGGLNGTTPKSFKVIPGDYRTPDGKTIRVTISKSGNWYAKSGKDYLGKRVNLKDCVRLDDAEVLA